MVRYLVAAALGCLYVAGSILIVQSAGQSYRADLNKTKRPAREIGSVSSSPNEEKDKSVPPIAALDVDTRQAELAIPKPARAPVTGVPTALVVEKPLPTPTEIAKAAPAIAPAEKIAAVAPAGKAAPANPLVKDAFWNHPKLTHVWDVAHLSTKEERDLGADLHQLIVRFNPLVEDPSPWLSRIDDATDPLLKMLQRKEIKYQFFILNSDVVNAFSIPGGNVYISRGLFDLIGEDEDYALQFAIGHEIAHVDLEHAVQCLRDPKVMKMTEGTLQKLFMLILPFGYLRDGPVNQEFAADDWIANKMQRLGRTRRKILVFLQKLEGYSKNHGFYGGEIKPRPGRDLSPLENHYRAQTAARKRLKHLKEFMDQAAKAPK